MLIMKKALSLFLALVLCLSLCACGGGNDTPKATEAPTETPTEAPTEAPTETTAPEVKVMTKEEMLNLANPLKREEVNKACNNMAFAKSLIGNVYTFNGIVYSVEEDYAVITFSIRDDEGIHRTGSNVMVANMHLSLEELLAIENYQELTLIGRLDDVSTVEKDGYYGTDKVVEMVFESAGIISDRFEKTGTLDSKNTSYGNNSWNIKFPNSNFLGLVSFVDDVSSYKGQEITYSYKSINDKCVDAYIVE